MTVETEAMKKVRPSTKAPLIHSKINKSPVNVNSIDAMTKDTDKMVSGTFVNIECPGQPAKISCKFYKGMEFFNQVFEDGQRYTIPMSVARHINENCKYEIHSYLTDENGKPLKTGKFSPRYKFTAEF